MGTVMRKLLILLLFLPLFAGATKYYCAPLTASPAGSDSHSGTIASPYFSLATAFNAASAGDTIYMRGGTYVYYSTQMNNTKSGTSGNLIKIWAYPGESPVITKGTPFNYSNMGSGVGSAAIYLRDVSFIHIKGIEICGFTQENIDLWRGLLAYDANNCIFENLKIHNNGLGMGVAHNSAGNLVLNCDFHHNYDPLSTTRYGNADGLQFAYIDGDAVNGSNTVSGCRCWSNSDDGFDCYENYSYMIFENCWSFRNGYMEDGISVGGNGCGFKLGQTSFVNALKRTITNSLAFQNRVRGFSQNEAQCIIQLYNNTSYANGSRGYDFWDYTAVHTVRNNIAYADGNTPLFTTYAVVDHNTFLYNGSNNSAVTVTNADFASVDSTGVSGARQSDGSLPNLSFLHLVAGSDLINAGTNVGLPYNGSAPDLGAFPYVATKQHGIIEQNNHIMKVTGKIIKQ